MVVVRPEPVTPLEAYWSDRGVRAR